MMRNFAKKFLLSIGLGDKSVAGAQIWRSQV
jgi:hypothetical protein